MEDLRRVMRTMGVARSRRLDALLDHMDDVAQQGLASSAHHPIKGAGNALVQQARSAYARVQAPATPERRPLTAVADVMSRSVVAVQDTHSLREAWQRLQAAGVGQAPVFNAQSQLVGLITRAELMRLDQLPEPEQSPLVWLAVMAQPVSAIMASPVPAVVPSTDIRRLAQVLLDTEYPGLPVVDGGDQVVGFVTRSDILKAIVNDPPLDLWS